MTQLRCLLLIVICIVCINYSAASATTYLYEDAVGNVIMGMDNQHQLTGFCQYSVYGWPSNFMHLHHKAHDVCYDSDERRDAANIAKNAFSYAGQYWDSANSMLAFGNGYRAYDPMTGHFMQADNMDAFDSNLTCNAFGYALANPMNFSDPSGHFSLPSIPKAATFALDGLMISSGMAALAVASANLPIALEAAANVVMGGEDIAASTGLLPHNVTSSPLYGYLNDGEMVMGSGIVSHFATRLASPGLALNQLGGDHEIWLDLDETLISITGGEYESSQPQLTKIRWQSQIGTATFGESLNVSVNEKLIQDLQEANNEGATIGIMTAGRWDKQSIRTLLSRYGLDIDQANIFNGVDIKDAGVRFKDMGGKYAFLKQTNRLTDKTVMIDNLSWRQRFAFGSTNSSRVIFYERYFPDYQH